ncbi:hypothetical protein RB195_024906 [Necator americanus]|uniref:Reverse transcriptase domain-containing protein n=1 Tax=Necator americanus TaxID=51031 RepID=A0ABR1EQ32_NECAM
MSLLCQSSIRDGTIASIKEDFPSQGEKRKPLSSESLRTIINWDLFATLAGFWEDSAMDNINEEYDRLVEHLHGFTRKAESFKTIKRRLSLETHELIRQHGAARTTVNQELTSKLARLCRAAIKEELSERPEEVLAEKKRSPCPPRNRKLQDKDVCSTEHEWSNDYIKKWNGENHPQLLQSFDTHVNLPSHHLREDGNVLPEHDYIYTLSKIIEVSREYKIPLCLSFIDLKKAYDTDATEAVMKALDNQGVPTHYIKDFEAEQKTVFMCNGWVLDAPFELNGANASECTSYFYLGREMNIKNDPDLRPGQQETSGFGSV